ncbi:phage tail assembly protein T, partial [Kitasatospora sp. NPDC001574]
LDRISSAELTDWIAYERITGPIGPERGDVLHGILTATVHNTAAKKKREPSDFVPKWAGKVRQSWQDMLAAVRAANAALGGTDNTTREED